MAFRQAKGDDVDLDVCDRNVENAICHQLNDCSDADSFSFQLELDLELELFYAFGNIEYLIAESLEGGMEWNGQGLYGVRVSVYKVVRHSSLICSFKQRSRLGSILDALHQYEGSI